ncbi:hypothetical protein NLX71_09020 [Paenibacillus sp. MZ04-78.2]|uniref:O-antigen ligase family protein n=1 Tax=Paenibacillus sp. MZ04-78.2 TaxID=2962034 RepID=UPI0020B85EEB|nr:hypothetical protein [Paenibacillus sp. MZ04-78.2]MCP3773456.1 hypothetical protein [Paenibacillus sp. MZ04-78.2]
MRSLAFHVSIILIIASNMLSFMKFEGDLIYALKFGLIFIHFLILLLHMIKQPVSITPMMKYLIAVFHCWTIVMCIGLTNSTTFAQTLSSLMSIGTYILLFFYSMILLPNYMRLHQIEYVSFVKVAYFTIVCCMALAVVLGLSDPKAFHLDPFSLRNRYLGYFRHPNFMGLYAFFGFAVSMLIYGMTKKKRYLLTVPFFAYLIYLSVSRTALLCVVLLLAVYLVRKYVFRLFYWSIRTSVISVCMLLIFVICLIQFVDIESLIADVDKLLSNRLTIWSNFWAGTETINEYIFGQGMAKASVSRDNYYLVVLLNTGILGLICFLIMAVSALYFLLKKYIRESSVSLEILLTIFIVLLLYSFAESILFTLGNAVSFFLWCSIGIHLTGRRAKDTDVARSVKPSPFQQVKLKRRPTFL